MGQPAARVGQAPRTGARYEDDLYSWVQEQVALLRDGRIDEIDVAHVAEELSDVGSEQFSKLESALTIVLLHMLKWDHQPERRSRSWDNSIEEHRARVAAVLRKNPGLKSRLGEAVGDAYHYGRARAASEIDRDRDAFPRTCPYSWDEIMTRDFTWTPPSDAAR